MAAAIESRVHPRLKKPTVGVDDPVAEAEEKGGPVREIVRARTLLQLPTKRGEPSQRVPPSRKCPAAAKLQIHKDLRE